MLSLHQHAATDKPENFLNQASSLSSYTEGRSAVILHSDLEKNNNFIKKLARTRIANYGKKIEGSKKLVQCYIQGPHSNAEGEYEIHYCYHFVLFLDSERLGEMGQDEHSYL